MNVPLFVEDDDGSLSGALKQAVAYGTGGFWLGAKHMKPNEAFLAEVRAAVPPATPVVVACQKGLRSISACEQLVRGGYETVAWLSGGFDAATAADFDTSNGKDMRYGAVGGMSGALGLSDVQREEAAMGCTVPGWVRAPNSGQPRPASDAAATRMTGHARHCRGAGQLAQRHVADAAQAVDCRPGLARFYELH